MNKKFINDYREFEPIIYSRLYNKLKDVHLVEDLLQNIFESYFKRIDKVENKRKWLLGAMRNQLFLYYQIFHFPKTD